MERAAEIEAMREMITDQEENIRKQKIKRDQLDDAKKRSQLNDQIKRLKKALMEDMVKYLSTIKKWKKEDQKVLLQEQGYEGDDEKGFDGGRRKRMRRKKRTKRRRSSRHRRSKKRRTRRPRRKRRRARRRRGGTLGKIALPRQFTVGGARSRYQVPTEVMKGGSGNVTIPPPTITKMM